MWASLRDSTVREMPKWCETILAVLRTAIGYGNGTITYSPDWWSADAAVQIARRIDMLIKVHRDLLLPIFEESWPQIPAGKTPLCDVIVAWPEELRSRLVLLTSWIGSTDDAGKIDRLRVLVESMKADVVILDTMANRVVDRGLSTDARLNDHLINIPKYYFSVARFLSVQKKEDFQKRLAEEVRLIVNESHIWSEDELKSLDDPQAVTKGGENGL